MNVILHTPFRNPFWDIPEREVEKLQDQFPKIRFEPVKGNQNLREKINDAEIFFGYRLQSEELQAAKNLKWIHVPAANVYGFNTPLLEERKILLTNSRGLHATAIAEHVIGAMLVFSRRFLDCWRFQAEHHYGQIEILKQGPPLFELRGKTVVILGLGAIGSEVANLAKAFGMRVLGIKRRINHNERNVDELFVNTDFRKALPHAHFLVISAARTPETEQMLGEAELSLLKPETVIINIARAQIIQQEALLRVLQEGKIRGAALDVFYEEPLPADSPLFTFPNVFISPHISGVSTNEHWPRMRQLFSQNLSRYLARRPLLNVVDLRTGY